MVKKLAKPSVTTSFTQTDTMCTNFAANGVWMLTLLNTALIDKSIPQVNGIHLKPRGQKVINYYPQKAHWTPVTALNSVCVCRDLSGSPPRQVCSWVSLDFERPQGPPFEENHLGQHLWNWTRTALGGNPGTQEDKCCMLRMQGGIWKQNEDKVKEIRKKEVVKMLLLLYYTTIWNERNMEKSWEQFSIPWYLAW